MPIPELLAAAPAIASSAIGIGQFIGGLIKGNKPRPQYNMPSEIAQSLGIAQNRASQTSMAGYDSMLDTIQSNTARSITAAKEASSGADILGAVGSASGREYDALKELGILNAQSKLSAEANLQKQLGVVAEYRDKEFQVNEMQPYLEAMDAARRLKEAGLQNLVGGMASGIRDYADIKGSEDWLNFLKSEYKNPLEERLGSTNQRTDIIPDRIAPEKIKTAVLEDVMANKNIPEIGFRDGITRKDFNVNLFKANKFDKMGGEYLKDLYLNTIYK